MSTGKSCFSGLAVTFEKRLRCTAILIYILRREMQKYLRAAAASKNPPHDPPIDSKQINVQG